MKHHKTVNDLCTIFQIFWSHISHMEFTNSFWNLTNYSPIVFSIEKWTVIACFYISPLVSQSQMGLEDMRRSKLYCNLFKKTKNKNISNIQSVTHTTYMLKCQRIILIYFRNILSQWVSDDSECHEFTIFPLPNCLHHRFAFSHVLPSLLFVSTDKEQARKSVLNFPMREELWHFISYLSRHRLSVNFDW